MVNTNYETFIMLELVFFIPCFYISFLLFPCSFSVISRDILKILTDKERLG